MLTAGMILMGFGALLTCMGMSIPVLELLMGPARPNHHLAWGFWGVALGFPMLLPLLFVVFVRPENGMEVRVGASWLQVDDGDRVSFDTLGSLQWEDDQLTVLASGLPVVFHDPDGRLHRVLRAALDAWSETAPTDEERDEARREHARLRQLKKPERGG